jgi:hypothetical protein
MSNVKSPQEKKTASLNLDRRNAYGENDKSSRKNIPLSKQRSHQAERRAVNEPLMKLTGAVDEDVAISVETEVKARAIKQKREGFRKKPDAPLKDVLIYRKTGTWPKC